MAKRKRLNVKFIVIGAMALMIAVAVGYVLMKTVFKPDPQKHFALAEQDIAKGDYEAAVKNISTGIRYSKSPDPAPWIKLADAVNHLMATKDPVELGAQWRGYIDQALSIDPQNKDALERRLDYHMDIAMLLQIRQAGNYEAINKFAQRLLAADPKNAKAQFALCYATLDQFLAGMQTDGKQVEEAETKLTQLLTTDPSNVEVPTLLSRLKLNRAAEAARGGDYKRSRQLMGETDQLVTEMLAKQPDNAYLRQRMGQILFVLADLYPATMPRPTTEPVQSVLVDSSKLPADLREALFKRQEYYTRAFAELETATKMAKPTDERYAEICTFYARQLERPAGKVKLDISREELDKILKDAHKEAEAVYREVIKNAPAERRVRVMLANFIGREQNRKEEAIALLAEPTPPNPKWIGIRASQAKLIEIEQLNALADLRLGLLEQKTKPDEKTAILQQVQADYDKMVALSSDNTPYALTVKGRLQLVKGDAVGAVQTFDRAMSLFSKSMDDRYELYELQFYYARSLLATQQTGQAKKIFRQIVSMNPAHLGARLELAHLLISEGNIRGTPPRFEDGALSQIDAAAPLLGENHHLIQRMRMLAASRLKDDKNFGEMWTKFPENTLAERLEKAKMAGGLGRTDEVIRLLELVRTEKPDDLNVTQELVRAYLSKNEPAAKDKALAILEDALKRHPENKGIQVAITQLKNPTEGLEEQRKRIEEIKDPMQRNLLLAEWHRQMGDTDKAFQYLLEAEKAAPDANGILAALFDTYLRRKEFDKAAGYMERLAKKNADNADGQVFRIRYALAQGKTQEAYDQAVKLVEIRKDFGQSHVLLGQTLQAMQRWDEAINAYQAGIDRQTGNTDAIKGLVECFMASGRPGKRSDDATGQKATDARFYLEMGNRLNGNDPYFKDGLVRWEIAYGDPQKAIESRAALVKERPDSPQAWLELGMVYFQAAQPQRPEDAAAAARAGNNSQAPVATNMPDLSDAKTKEFLGKARDTFAEAVKKWPEEPRFMQALVETHLQLKEIDQAEKVIIAFVSQPKYKTLPDSTQALADFYERANQPAKAEKVLRDALTATPDNISFQIRLARLLRGQNKVEDALKVLDANPDHPSVARERVETFTRAGRLQEASQYLDGRLAKDPNNDFYQRLRANVDLGLGKLDQVRATAKRILDANPNDLDGLYLRARATLADPSGDVRSAITDLVRVVNIQPNSVDARVQLANAQRRAGLYEDAVRSVEGAVERAPNDKLLRLQLLDTYVNSRPPKWFEAENFLKQTRAIPQFANDIDLIHVEAKMWLVRKDSSKALNLIREAIKQNPDNPAFVQTYFGILAENKDFNTLIAEADKTLKAKPDLYWVYQYRGIAKVGRNDKAGGLADLKLALNGAIKANDLGGAEAVAKVIADKLGIAAAREALMPFAEKDPHWQLVLGNMLMLAGDTAGALSLTEKALSVANLKPDELEVGLKLAGVLYMTSSPPNVPKAIECYRRLLKDFPNDANVLNNLAYLLLEPGPTYNPTEAVTYSQRVLDLTIANDDQASLPMIQDTHAWALINSGKPDEGIALLRDALSKKKFLDGFYHLGEGFLRKTPPDTVEAERAFRDGLDYVRDAQRQQQVIDPNMKAKIEASLDRVKNMNK